MSQFTDRDFRTAMGQFCTGVVVVTGIREGRPLGFSAQSFVSVSLTPPLVAICPARSSTSWPRLREAGRFGINILGADQLAVCETFARSGGDKFEHLGWSPAADGVPMLDGVIGFVGCELVAEHEAGDHTVVIAQVLDLRIHCAQRSPLLFFRGTYGGFGDLPGKTSSE